MKARLLLLGLSMAVAAAATALAGSAGSVIGAPPASPDPSEHYVFYLHGAIVEREGRQAVSPDHGRYDFDGVTKALADGGFEVIAALRQPDDVEAHAKRAALDVRGMVLAGVPADHLAVVGFSKGGAIALRVAELLSDPKITYVVMAGCFPESDREPARLQGRILSIRDASDEQSDPCAAIFASGGKGLVHEEVTLSTGLRHGLFYRPRKEWVDPVVRFLRGEGAAPKPSATQKP